MTISMLQPPILTTGETPTSQLSYGETPNHLSPLLGYEERNDEKMAIQKREKENEKRKKRTDIMKTF
jgi:hypothetical protein